MKIISLDWALALLVPREPLGGEDTSNELRAIAATLK